jgi:hypothetical protein
MKQIRTRAGTPELAVVPMDDAPEEWDYGHRRAEKRDRVVRIVEYSEYPRAKRDQLRRVAYTRDESRSGMCLTSDAPESVGALLRVATRGLGAASTRDALARVCWCNAQPDGRYWMGLQVVEKGRRMLTVRRPGEGGMESDGAGDATMAKASHSA